MRIRWKLLSLLLLVALLPLLADAALSIRSRIRSGRKAANYMREVLVTDGEKDLRVAVEHAAELTSSHAHAVHLIQGKFRLALAGTVADAADATLEPQRAPLLAGDLDRGEPLPVKLVVDPRYTPPGSVGAPVSFDDWAFSVAPGSALDTDAAARLQRILPIVQDLAADRRNQVVRYFFGTETGTHGGFPAQGSFPDGYDPRLRAWYGLARERDSVSTTPPYIDAASRRVVVSLVWRLESSDGRFLGVGGVDVDTTEILENIDLPPQWGDGVEVMIVSPDGSGNSLRATLAADRDPERELNLTEWDVPAGDVTSGDSAADARLLAVMAAQASGVLALPYEGQPAWWGFARLMDRDSFLLVIVLEERMTANARAVADGIEQETRAQVVFYGVIALAAALAVVAIALAASIAFTRPIRELLGSVRKVADGDLETHAEVKTGDELEELAGNFNRMVGQLKSQMESLEVETAAREQVEAELRIAREMQSSLLPACEPPYSDHAQFDLAALNLPAKYVAGDFYDFAFLDDRTLAVVMADVSGKGVPAALFMTVCLTLLRIAAAANRLPGEVFERVNRVLHASKTDRAVFVTAILGYYDIPSGRLQYANAGHCTPIVVGPDGTITHLEGPTGTILAPFEGMNWGTNETILERGARLVLYTDGITEARRTDGELLGEEGLDAFLRAETASPHDPDSAELVQRISSLAVSRMDDDVTVMVLRRT